MISRTITVVTRIIARTLKPMLTTVEEVPHGSVYIIDGTLLPCWSWKDQPDLRSGKHKRTGLNLQVLVSLAGHLQWASDPLPGGYPRRQGDRHFRSPEGDRPLQLYRR